ncbi:MAG TPA: sensor domain-containing diguanylate cyclase [bacterium]|nr:sensor domain-containing diguanylate cyclase [bacterium]
MIPPTHRRGATDALSMLATLTQGLTAAFDITQVVDWTLKALRENAGFDSCTIALLDADHPEILTIVAGAGLASVSRGLSLPRPQGFNWMALMARRALYIPDTHRDGRHFQCCEDIRSSMHVPLIADGEAVGSLAAHGSTVDAFTPNDRALLDVVGQYLAGVLAIARLQDRLQKLADTDPLTGLPNRRRFLSELEREISRSRRTAAPLTVALLDLDGFKSINDVYGHAAGDSALMQVARTLRQRLRASDVLARFGGDEFAMLFPETGPRGPAVLQRLAPIVVTVDPVDTLRSLGVSWGAASSPLDGPSAEALLSTADARLYGMKRARKRSGPDLRK